jgi:hypothetical protein
MNIDPQSDDIGRHVLYYQRGTGAIEEGSIVSFNDVYVFVRFESPTPKACHRSDLEWSHIPR